MCKTDLESRLLLRWSKTKRQSEQAKKQRKCFPYYFYHYHLYYFYLYYQYSTPLWSKKPIPVLDFRKHWFIGYFSEGMLVPTKKSMAKSKHANFTDLGPSYAPQVHFCMKSLIGSRLPFLSRTEGKGSVVTWRSWSIECVVNTKAETLVRVRNLIRNQSNFWIFWHAYWYDERVLTSNYFVLLKSIQHILWSFEDSLLFNM